MPFLPRSSSPPRPRNRPASAMAVRALERLTAAINEQLDNSLLVNGYEVLVYNRLKAGLHCSCSGHVLTSRLGLDGSADAATMQELLQGGTFGFADYASGPAGPAGRNARPNVLTNGGDDILANRRELAHGETEFASGGYRNATGQDNGLDLDDEFPLNPFAEGHLIGCPVCFGTGFVGGFSVTNSWRCVVCAATPGVVLIDGNIDTLPKPSEFVLASTESFVQFGVRLPAGGYRVDAMRAFNGVQVLGGEVQLQYLDAQSGSWGFLTAALLLTLCDGTAHQFRIQSMVPLQRVTHLELQLGLSTQALLVEFPKLVETADTSILEALTDVQLSCSTKIPQLRPFDVMSDMNNQRLWMVREVTRFNNDARSPTKTNFGLEASARVVQTNEIFSILPLRRSTVGDSRQRAQDWGGTRILTSTPPR